MNYLIILLIAGCVFGLCFLADKGFTKLFRNQKQHRSGLSVRLSKRYGAIGLIVSVLGIAAIIAGVPGKWLYFAAGALLIFLGVALIVYYMSFSIFYDEDQFILSTFGKSTKTYYYKEILSQQLFNSYGNIVIELHLSDGRTVQLQGLMEGVYPFLDKAFWAWLRQTGRTKESCDFYDPDNSCWFPPLEV